MQTYNSCHKSSSSCLNSFPDILHCNTLVGRALPRISTNWSTLGTLYQGKKQVLSGNVYRNTQIFYNAIRLVDYISVY